MAKMTDNEIIKALECCISKLTCDTNCPMWSVQHCGLELRKEALNLINRQKAEIERLQKAKFGVDLSISSIKAEAKKEVFEELISMCDAPYWCVWLSEITDLAEKMGVKVDA